MGKEKRKLFSPCTDWLRMSFFFRKRDNCFLRALWAILGKDVFYLKLKYVKQHMNRYKKYINPAFQPLYKLYIRKSGYTLTLLSFFDTNNVYIVENPSHEGSNGKDPCIIDCQYHGCWWTNEARIGHISSHSTDLIFVKYSGIGIIKAISKLYHTWSIITSSWMISNR